MLGESSAEFACGQVLYNIKMSKLNYMVQETPYSAYITVRKKFVKGVVDIKTVEPDEIKKMLNEKRNLKKENMELREKLIDKDKTIGTLEYANEEFEVKNEKLESERIELDDRLEELYSEISHLKQNENKFLKVSDANTKLKDKMKSLETEMRDLKTDLKKVKSISVIKDMAKEVLESDFKDSEKKIIELKQVIQSNEDEIKKLNASVLNYCGKCEEEVRKVNVPESKHSDEDKPTTSKCGECLYESDEESDMKLHIKTNHEFTCNICGFAFQTQMDLKTHTGEEHASNIDESETSNGSQVTTIGNHECEICNLQFRTDYKMKNHMCRVTVKNPSFCDLYTKNWIILNRCTPIYHRIHKEEVTLLHCVDSVENKNRCSEKFPIWLPAQEDVENGIWHLDLSKYLNDGRMDWQALKMIR